MLYRIERAKSSRSTCSSCEQKIAPHSIRVRAAHGIEARKGIPYYQTYCDKCIFKYINNERWRLDTAQKEIEAAIVRGRPEYEYIPYRRPKNENKK